MRIKILGFVFVCLLLFVGSGLEFSHAKAEANIQEDTEITEQKIKLKDMMKDIDTISKGLADFVTDHGVAPKQDGIYDENSEFYNALFLYYLKVVPIYDKWGNNIWVYCGEACNGKYGISGCGEDDFVVVSYGQDGKKEDWEFDVKNPAAGLYLPKTLDDFDKDLVMWNCIWIRAPRRLDVK